MASPLKAGFHRLEIQKTTWDVPDRYTSLNPVGSGAYGTVCSAIDQKTKEKVAIKKLYRPFQSLIHAKRAYRELRLLRHIQHDNVICLLNVFTPEFSLDRFQTFYLVMPFVAQDLGHIMKKRRLTDRVIAYLFYQLLRGLKYIHSAGIIHRDLKPNNLAIDENCELKILDFGLARHAEMEMTGYVVTRWYRAPEVIFNWMHYTQTVDIWSAGCILAEMITGQVLFPGNDIHNKTKQSFNPKGCNSNTKQLQRNPARPKIQNKVWPKVPVFCFDKYKGMDQLNMILDLTGTPHSSLVQKMQSKDARSYVQSLPVQKKKDFRKVFPTMDSCAVDLLEKTLMLDPEYRLTAKDGLSQPYLSEYHDPDNELESPPYDDSFESLELAINEWKSLIHMEIMTFDPDNPRQTAT